MGITFKFEIKQLLLFHKICVNITIPLLIFQTVSGSERFFY